MQLRVFVCVSVAVVCIFDENELNECRGSGKMLFLQIDVPLQSLRRHNILHKHKHTHSRSHLHWRQPIAGSCNCLMFYIQWRKCWFHQTVDKRTFYAIKFTFEEAGRANDAFIYAFVFIIQTLDSIILSNFGENFREIACTHTIDGVYTIYNFIMGHLEIAQD